mmetsp:Transcript_8020/g.22127  ORF Transcript_8020/g.22127 Transcript_8020/m.22127 type:complete len:230 (+) Transcript_8020:428-1117(+)
MLACLPSARQVLERRTRCWGLKAVDGRQARMEFFRKLQRSSFVASLVPKPRLVRLLARAVSQPTRCASRSWRCTASVRLISSTAPRRTGTLRAHAPFENRLTLCGSTLKALWRRGLLRSRSSCCWSRGVPRTGRLPPLECMTTLLDRMLSCCSLWSTAGEMWVTLTPDVSSRRFPDSRWWTWLAPKRWRGRTEGTWTQRVSAPISGCWFSGASSRPWPTVNDLRTETQH